VVSRSEIGDDQWRIRIWLLDSVAPTVSKTISVGAINLVDLDYQVLLRKTEGKRSKLAQMM